MVCLFKSVWCAWFIAWCFLPFTCLQPNATELFKSVKEAYEVLSDPHQRAAYNKQRLQVRSSWVSAWMRAGHVVTMSSQDASS